MQALLTFVFPLSFVGFYPACDFLGQSDSTSLSLDVALWTPAVGAAMLVLALRGPKSPFGDRQLAYVLGAN